MIAVVREALASLRAGAGRSLLLAIALSLCMAAPALLDGLTASGAERAYRTAIADGSEVLVVRAGGDGWLSTARCEAAANSDAVLAAGAVTPVGVGHSITAPGLGFQEATISSRYLDVIAPVEPGGRTSLAVAVGESLAGDLSLVPGARIETGEGISSVVGALVNTSARAPEQIRWMFSVVTTRRAAQCWVEASPGTRDNVAALLRTIFVTQVPDVRVTALRGDEARAVVVSWSRRPTQFAWACASGIGSLLVVLLWIPRRGEFALRMTLGFSRAAIVLQLCIELLCLAVIAAICAAAWSFFILALAGASTPISGLYAWRSLAYGYCGLAASAPIVAFAPIGSNVSRSLRER